MLAVCQPAERHLTAIERWLRPVAYQNTPEALLPPELHDANPLGLPRRCDGRLEH